jgi:protein-tyrosine phosphatase
MSARANELSVARERVISLEGGVNFRDIGGYRAGAHAVRWGKVFRAGVLCYFSPNDHPTLGALGIRAICDLRRAEERQREPTRWPDTIAEGLSWADGEAAPTIRAFAATRPLTAAGMRDSMLELYRALPTWMGPRIRGLFECVANERVPLVIHCAAGKDRTGVAIAVLLAALGVDQPTIIEDYLLTNAVGNFEQFIAARQGTHLGLADAHQPLLSMPPEMREILFLADADYLQAALTQIKREYGDMENYLKTGVLLDDRTLARVRESLLE